MTRNKKVEIRLTSEELTILEQYCASLSMTKSELIRKLILDLSYSPSTNINRKAIAPHICIMQNIVNKIIAASVTEEDVLVLRKEMDTLWLYLK